MKPGTYVRLVDRWNFPEKYRAVFWVFFKKADADGGLWIHRIDDPKFTIWVAPYHIEEVGVLDIMAAIQ